MQVEAGGADPVCRRRVKSLLHEFLQRHPFALEVDAPAHAQTRMNLSKYLIRSKTLRVALLARNQTASTTSTSNVERR